MENENKSSKKKLLILLLLLLFLIIFGIALYMDLKKEKSYIIPDFTYEGIDYKKKDNIDLLFFAGIDSFDRNVFEKGSYQNDYAADTIILFVLDKNAETITPIHINSELMCDYDISSSYGKEVGEVYGQANYAHAYGSGGIDSLINVKDTVRGFMTGVSIEYYLSTTMDSIPEVNDAFNYVKVYVEDDFSSIDSSIKQHEVNTLVGQQSLTFIRSKIGVGDGTNVSRMNRQKVYFDALFNKVKEKSKENPDLIADTYESVIEYICSNSDIYELTNLTNEFIEYDLQDPVMIKGDLKENEDGTTCYIPNEKDIIPVCIEYFYNRINY